MVKNIFNRFLVLMLVCLPGTMFAGTWHDVIIKNDKNALKELIRKTGIVENCLIGDFSGVHHVGFDQEKFDEAINEKNEKGETPLIVAIKNNAIEIVKMLLELDPNINLQDNKGKTAIIHAVEQDNFEILQLLLKANADLNKQDIDGYTVLMYAVCCSCYSNDFQILKALLLDKNINLDIQNKEGYTALHLATQQGDFYTVATLLDAKATVTTQNSNGDTPLHSAVYNGSISLGSSGQIISLLLKANACLFTKNKNNQTPYDVGKIPYDGVEPLHELESKGIFVLPRFYLLFLLDPHYKLLLKEQKSMRDKYGFGVVLNDKDEHLIRSANFNQIWLFGTINSIRCYFINNGECSQKATCPYNHDVAYKDLNDRRIDLMIYLFINDIQWDLHEALKISTGQKQRQEKAIEEQLGCRKFQKLFDLNIKYL